MLETTEDRSEFEAALGRRLIADGRLDAASLERAGRLRVESGERLERVLTKLGMVTEGDMAAALAGELGVKLARSHDFPADKVVEAEVSARFLRESQVVPIAENGDGIVLAMVDPLDDYAIKAMELIAGKPVRVVHKQFPLRFHPHARAAALAALAAHQQGRFDAVHKGLFADQEQLNPEQIQAVIRAAGVDTTRYTADLAAAERLLAEDIAEAERAGLDGTPTFYVNGLECTLGDLPQAIEDALAIDR